MSVATIRTALASIADVSTVARVCRLTPKVLAGKLPAATVYWAGFEPKTKSTSMLEDIGWLFHVDFYIDLSDEEAAQTHLDTIGPAFLLALRQNPDLSGTCEKYEVRDGGEPVVLAPPNKPTGVFMKRIIVVATTEESD